MIPGQGNLDDQAVHPSTPAPQHEQIRTRGDVPDSEKRLRKQIAKLKELRASDAAEIQQLKADVEALVGALHLAQLENQRLCETSRPGTTVRMLPPPGPPS
ncbi:hypothetical protein NEH83_17285 [Streptomyces sp. JUS-F4]|uniref:hypothetical protein n=1 Tax=Streptomyces sp. JUS-F4 TaxID=2951988 RepID=UPI002666AAB6|nr:hypothetical protein [Streptomyces sp. JUS-F4]WKN15778.1 hypothetical protein NEH83_17285 [Streptomyces sp. JUS-F4]